MKRVLTSLAALMALAIAGCATYKEGGVFGGFNETPLARDTYRIQSYGNAYTTRQRTNAIALVRAAELAASNGYDRFIILNYDEWAATSFYTTPTTVNTNTNFSGSAYTNASANCYGQANAFGSGNYAYANASSTCSGNSRTNMYGNASSRTTINHGQTYEIEKPRTDVVVRFIHPSSPEANTALLVRETVSRYGNSAGLKPEEVQFILQSVRLGADWPDRQATPSSLATTVVTPAGASTSRRERSEEEVYRMLAPHERSKVDAMSFAERSVYLYTRRHD